MISRRAFALSLTLIVFILDQTSKQLILDWFFSGNSKIEVTSFLNFILSGNTGITFGMLQLNSSYFVVFLCVVTLFISILLLKWLWKAESVLSSLGLSLILGGALGNLIDRLMYGKVVDFIDFHVFGYHWYTFNIADCAIVVGVVLFIIHQLFFLDKEVE